MTIDEFMQEMRALEVRYRQEYSKEEAEAIYEDLQSWNLEKFQAVCNRIKEKIFDLPKSPHFLSVATGLMTSSLVEEEPRRELTPEEKRNYDRTRIKATAAYWYWILDDPKTGMALAKKAQGMIDGYKKQGYEDVLVEAKKFCDEEMKKRCPYQSEKKPVELTEEKRRELRVLAKRWRDPPTEG